MENFEDLVIEEVRKSTKLTEEISSNNKKHKQQIDELNETVAQLKDSGGGRISRKSLGQMAVESLKAAGLDNNLTRGQHKTVTVKSAATMTTSNVDGVGSGPAYALIDAESGLSRIQRRRPFIMDIANVQPTTGKVFIYSDQVNPDGGAAATSEGSSKSQIDFDVQEVKVDLQKITAYVKASRESLEDVSYLRNEIDNELLELVYLKADEQLLSGNGTPPNLTGLLTMDTPYSSGSFAGTILDPNEFDVLRTAIAQITAANFTPTHILLHPNDAAKMQLVKDSLGQPIFPSYAGPGGQEIAGVRIVQNTGITEGNFTVGDFTKFNVRVREGMMIDVGLDGEDFTKNLVTILCEIRLCSFIKSVHTAAFVSGDFASAKTALGAP